jgi:predicted RNA binding protein YcfA (HicA-like mRNA interferase family)
MKYEYKKEYWDNTAIDLETKLNAMGADGWDCFHIEGAHFYFKKPYELTTTMVVAADTAKTTTKANKK